MAKRLTEKQKKEITKGFKSGKTIESLSEKFDYSKLTIIRNLKKELGEKTYEELNKNNKKTFQCINNNVGINTEIETAPSVHSAIDNFGETGSLDKNDYETNLFPVSEFIEISPLDCEIENSPRKELSSIPIANVEFPNIVYMIVNKNIELEIKLLKEYPEWEFLPNEDLKRKTIEIYFDLKKAKRDCNKEQKVIKVPNTDVFRIVSPILISRGISRIVSAQQLIAL